MLAFEFRQNRPLQLQVGIRDDRVEPRVDHHQRLLQTASFTRCETCSLHRDVCSIDPHHNIRPLGARNLGNNGDSAACRGSQPRSKGPLVAEVRTSSPACSHREDVIR